MNDYDKAGRYLVKRDPAGFFRWLLADADLEVEAWIDARRVVLPDQDDLTQDLVTALRKGAVREAICLELEAEARADALPRLLMYLGRLWTEPGSHTSLAVSCVGGVILDLTGHSPTRELKLRSALVPDARLELTVLRRSLAVEHAAPLVAGVVAGAISPWVLGWVPLMRGGSPADIIMPWRTAAERLIPEERDRSVLGVLTVTFATLVGQRAHWERGLRGWNMQTSPYWDEVRAEARVEGRIEGIRETILHQGRRKFGKGPTRKQQKALEAVTDPAQLEALAARLLSVGSWADLLNGANHVRG
jgi:hypothetical protein